MIKVYSKRTFCAACRQTKLAFAKQGTEFEEIVVDETDAEMLQFLKSRGHSSFPVVIVSDGMEWSGFRPDHIKKYSKDQEEDLWKQIINQPEQEMLH